MPIGIGERLVAGGQGVAERCFESFGRQGWPVEQEGDHPLDRSVHEVAVPSASLADQRVTIGQQRRRARVVPGHRVEGRQATRRQEPSTDLAHGAGQRRLELLDRRPHRLAPEDV